MILILLGILLWISLFVYIICSVFDFVIGSKKEKSQEEQDFDNRIAYAQQLTTVIIKPATRRFVVQANTDNEPLYKTALVTANTSTREQLW